VRSAFICSRRVRYLRTLAWGRTVGQKSAARRLSPCWLAVGGGVTGLSTQGRAAPEGDEVAHRSSDGAFLDALGDAFEELLAIIGALCLAFGRRPLLPPRRACSDLDR